MTAWSDFLSNPPDWVEKMVEEDAVASAAKQTFWLTLVALAEIYLATGEEHHKDKHFSIVS